MKSQVLGMTARLQEVEGGGVEEEEGHKIERPHQLVHKGLTAQIPQRQTIISVVDEVHQSHRRQWQTDRSKDDPERPCAN